MRKKLVSCILVVCMLLTMLPTMAWAEDEVPSVELTETPVVEQTEQQEQQPAPVAEFDGTLDIADGSIVITATGYTQGDAAEETAYTGDYVITQSATDTLSNYIHINGGTHNITLNGVKLNGWLKGNESDTKNDKGPFFVDGNATVTLTLIGTNNLNTTEKSAALEVVSGSTVTIKVPDGQNDTYGTLTAENTNDRECAGIGSSRWRSAGTVIIKSGTVVAKSATNGHVSGIGPGRRQDMEKIEIAGGVVTVTGGTAMGCEGDTNTKVNTLEISGGTLTSSLGISADSYDITGGNIIAASGLPETDSNSRKLAKLYVVGTSGAAKANTEVEVTVTNGTPWKSITDAEGIITTYLHDSDKVNGTDKLNGGWLIGGTCTCAPTAFDWGSTISTAEVFSTAMTVPVEVTVDKCSMPIHKLDDVEWTVTEGNAVKNGDKLTLNPAATDYIVVLKATLGSATLNTDTHTINVKADSTIKSIDIGNGPVTVEAAAEAGKVVYKQDGAVVYTVDESEKVVIFGTYSYNTGNINAIHIKDCSPTIVLENVTLSDAASPKNEYLSTVLIEGTDATADHAKLLISGENKIVRSFDGGNSRAYCGIEVKNAELTIDCVEESGCSDAECPHKLIIDMGGGALSPRGAGIGTRFAYEVDGAEPDGFTLNIDGGYVQVNQRSGYAAAIGTCWVSGNTMTKEFAINISDGYVLTEVKDSTTAIGTGRTSEALSNTDNMSISITGGVVKATATAVSTNGGKPTINAGNLVVSGDADVTVKGSISADSVELKDNAKLDLGKKDGWSEEMGTDPGGSISNGYNGADGPVLGTTAVKVSDFASLTAAGGINGSLEASGAASVKINGAALADEYGDPPVVGGVSGNVTVGAGSSVTVAEEIGGTLIVKDGGFINDTKMTEDITVATPDGKTFTPNDDGTFTPSEGILVNDDGTITAPAGSTVTKEDGSSVELSDGGDVAADGGITAGGTVVTKDKDGKTVSTVVVPDGKTATVGSDGKITAPAGTTVTDKDGKENTLTIGGTVTADGTVKHNSYGYYIPTTTPSDKPADNPADKPADKPATTTPVTPPAEEVVTPAPEDKPAVDEPVVDEPVVDDPAVDVPADDTEQGGGAGLWIGIGIVALAGAVGVLGSMAVRKKKRD